MKNKTYSSFSNDIRVPFYIENCSQWTLDDMSD